MIPAQLIKVVSKAIRNVVSAARDSMVMTNSTFIAEISMRDAISATVKAGTEGNSTISTTML